MSIALLRVRGCDGLGTRENFVMRWMILLSLAAGQLFAQVFPGASGTVTSVGLAGTTNQLCVSGTTPVTTSGGWTISLCNAVEFPGLAVFRASGASVASFRVPSGTAPTTPTAGDFWNASGLLYFYDGSATQTLLFAGGNAAGLSGQYIDYTASSGGSSIANKPTLGGAAALGVGTTAGTVAAGDDSRIVGAVPNSITVNGHALSGDVTVTPTDLSLLIGTNTEAWSATLDSWASKAVPTGVVVGDTDTIALTNKTVDGVTPTVFGYLDPSSSVQTQLNGKAPAVSPVFTAASLGASYMSTTKTAGSGGVSANLLCKIDSTGNVVMPTTADGTAAGVGVLGVCITTQIAAAQVEVATRGIVNGVADNSTTIGNLVGVGSTTAGRAKDLGQTSTTQVCSDVQIIGKGLAAVSAGAALSVQLYGPGHYGSKTCTTSTTALTGIIKGSTGNFAGSAACADLSNAAASCSTDTTSATNISSGTLAAARLPNTTMMMEFVGTAAGATVAASATNYFSPGASAGVAGETSRQWVAEVACTLRGFHLRTVTTGPTGTMVVTVRTCTPSSGVCTGSDTSITATVTTGATANLWADAGHTATVAAGDYISIKFVNNDGSAASAQIGAYSLGCWPN